MAKSKRKSPGRSRATASSALGGGISRRKLLGGGVALVAGGLGAAGLHAYDTNQRTLHDLSVVGNGVPAIVQVHDPGCRLCRRLKAATTEALEAYDGINYRLADVTRPEGKAVQDRFNVPHVTLLYFNGRGEMIHSTNGTLPADRIAEDIEVMFNK
ncbi:MAG: hypothetical protein AAGA11_23040 [Pseudomonadota bacterium]